MHLQGVCSGVLGGRVIDSLGARPRGWWGVLMWSVSWSGDFESRGRVSFSVIWVAASSTRLGRRLGAGNVLCGAFVSVSPSFPY